MAIDYCRFLAKQFGQTKAQAIRAKCGGIKPKRSIRGVEPFWTPQSCSAFQIFANGTNQSYYGQGVIAVLMSNRPNRKPELLIYDTVTNDLPDGICINDVLIRNGYAKKDPKWTKHGLLPWEYPYEQLRQAETIKIKELGAALAEVTTCSSLDKEEMRIEIPPELVKESIDKVKLWLDTQKNDASAASESNFKEGSEVQ